MHEQIRDLFPRFFSGLQAALGITAMAVFRFQQELEFIRFLNDTDILRHGLIDGVIRKGPFGGAVEVVTGALPDQDFERLSTLVTPYHGRVAFDEESQDMASRGIKMGRYIESIHAQPDETEEAADDPDILLMVEGSNGRFEAVRDRIYRYGFENEFRVMAGKLDRDTVFLFRVRGLKSSYPLMGWETEGFKLFVPLPGEPNCFIERGLRFPLQDLRAYHPELGAINLVGKDGWWWRSDRDDFHPIGDLSEVHIAGAHPPRQIESLAPEELPNFSVELRLQRNEEVLQDITSVDHEARLRELEEQRWKIDHQIEQLRSQDQVSPICYLFASESISALIQFATRHPLGQVSKFLYCILRDESSNGMHLVIPEDLERSSCLPDEIGNRAQIYQRRPDWFRQHRFNVFLPEGHQLVPPLEFSHAEGLEIILGGQAEDSIYLFIESKPGELSRFAITRDACVPLQDCIKFTNRQVVAENQKEIAGTLRSSLVEEQRRAFEAAKSELERLRTEVDDEVDRS